MTRRRPSNLYALLGLLAVLAFTYQIVSLFEMVRFLDHPLLLAPFGVAAPWPTIRWVRPEASEAGLRPGDRILRLNGRTVRSFAALFRPRTTVLPGQTIDVSYERNGVQRQAQIRAAASRGRAHRIAWVWAWVVFQVVPTLALGVGVWVAAVRPRDPRAWLVLAGLY